MPEFTQDWFSHHAPVWKQLIEQTIHKADRVLEIGAFEGRATTWMIEHLLFGCGHITCVDTWEGGRDHHDLDMKAVEERFDRNMKEASHKGLYIRKIKGPSTRNLAALVATQEIFDFIYLDGSHECPDVLTDLVLAYHLVRKGGIIICDDYLFHTGARDSLLLKPKMAIDAAVNCFHNTLAPLGNLPLYQLALLKF